MCRCVVTRRLAAETQILFANPPLVEAPDRGAGPLWACLPCTSQMQPQAYTTWHGITKVSSWLQTTKVLGRPLQACATLCLLVLARLHRSFKHSVHGGTGLATAGVTIVTARLARLELDIRCIWDHFFCSSVRPLTFTSYRYSNQSSLSPCDQILQSFIHQITFSFFEPSFHTHLQPH